MIFQIVTSAIQNKLFEESTVFGNDPARFIKIKSWTPELRNMVLRLGPYQPSIYELENKCFLKILQTEVFIALGTQEN